MPRKLTESAKLKRTWDARPVKELSEIPDEIKRATVEFFAERKESAKEIAVITEISLSTVHEMILRFRQYGTCAARTKKKRPSSVVNKRMIRRVYLMLHRDNTLSMRAIAKKIGIDEKSVRRIVSKLNARSYKMGRGQLLTGKDKERRLKCAKKMLSYIDKNGDEEILFSDECLISVGPLLNRQNHRQILTRRARKSERWKTIGHQQYPGKQFFMVIFSKILIF